MRHHLFTFFILFSICGFGQSVQQKEVPSSEKQTNSVNYNQSIQTEQEDMIRSAVNFSAADKSAAIQQSFTSFQSTYRQSQSMAHRKSPTPQQQKEMDEQLVMLQLLGPDSYEYNLSYYQAGRHDVSRVEFLKKAEKAKQQSKDLAIQFAAYHSIKENAAERKKYLDMMYNGGYFNNDLLVYAEDILNALPRQATLITHGTDDTFPLLILQDVKGVRKDVQVLSLDLVQSAEYRKLWSAKGYKFPNKDVVDASFYEEFCKLNNSKLLYHSLTIPSKYLSKLSSDFGINGLVMTVSADDKQNYQLYLKQFKGKAIWKSCIDCWEEFEYELCSDVTFCA
jgi:hypothetical protein